MEWTAIRGTPLRWSTRTSAFALHAEQAVVGAHPEVAVAVFEDDAHEAVGQSFGRAEGAKRAVAVADQSAAFGAGPQRAVARRQQRVDAIVAEGGLVSRELKIVKRMPSKRTRPPLVPIHR